MSLPLRSPVTALALLPRADELGSGECPARVLTRWPRWLLPRIRSGVASAACADELGSGECPARALTRWPRWLLPRIRSGVASAACADQRDQAVDGERIAGNTEPAQARFRHRRNVGEVAEAVARENVAD